ncbi:hypothetical protein B0H67DRAFT_571003 [Lasiosphaeris hirsuta]|uniref:Secreted protein n=1 Tax=Lasiosphaeris hirsuta TaxID=260670 RepID=A0AA40B0U8_9PEZI|nr:hypothetical protein B0H67DRAFT_571003 [Lasiosphaeris hirsuta]
MWAWACARFASLSQACVPIECPPLATAGPRANCPPYSLASQTSTQQRKNALIAHLQHLQHLQHRQNRSICPIGKPRGGGRADGRARGV